MAILRRMTPAFLFLLLAALTACTAVSPTTPTPAEGTPAPTRTPQIPTPTPTVTILPPIATPTVKPAVPEFSHVVIIMFENREFGSVIGSADMPNFNRYAEEGALLSQYYGIRHPSLPNYLALIGGDTFGVDRDCETCWVDAPSLPDLIEASGRTWKAYLEGMPSPCFLGSYGNYAQKHNPFVYFTPIRTDKARCEVSDVPLTTLDEDLSQAWLPDFAFIMPDLCNSAHDCSTAVADKWLKSTVERLRESPAWNSRSLIVITWDEGQGDHSCCGLKTGGGRVATVLLSQLVRPGYVDETPYTHYSLLRTISSAWNLELLGHAADDTTALIQAPWLP